MGISLVKGQKISLEKGDGSSLTQIYLGAGWDVAKSGGGFFGMFKGGDDSIDLDASLILFNDQILIYCNNSFDHLFIGKTLCWYFIKGILTAYNYSVYHICKAITVSILKR